jgi:hypothetical protein
MMQLEEEEKAIEKRYATQIRLAGDDADLVDKINIKKAEDERKLADKRKKLEYEQAKAKKQQALIDAGINIALGITAALSTLPPASFIMAGITAALGAIELTAIAAAPLPKYADGTDYHPGGHAMLGDGGKEELAIGPDGSVYLSGNKPEIVDLPKGSSVMADAKDFINREVMKSILEIDKKQDEQLADKITDAVQKGFKGVKITNNNNVDSNIDFQMWRNALIN